MRSQEAYLSPNTHQRLSVLEGTRYEIRWPKEKSGIATLGTTIMDTFRDLDTANKMAASKFDGDSALMHMARGFVSGAVGAGLEIASDQLWKKKWTGTEAIFPSAWFKVGSDIDSKMKQLAKKNPKLYYFVREGTQDLAIGALYNFIAFRSQPLLPQTEPKHLLASLATNAGESFFSKDMDQRVKREFAPDRDINEGKLQEKSEYLQDLLAKKGKKKLNSFDQKQLNKTNKEVSKLKKALYGTDLPPGVVQVALNLSNPITWLGVDMVWSGATTLAKNFVEVRKVRTEKGGLPGKTVYMPKENKVYYGNSRGNGRKREDYERTEDA